MKVVANGIDVSEYQGIIDWGKIKKSGKVDFVMLRAVIGTRKDDKFDANYSGAKQNGIAVGCYLYSKATTTKQAEAEAKKLLEVIKGKTFEYPIAYDIEDSTQGINPDTKRDNLSNSIRTSLVKTFCSKIKSSGYYPMIYTSKYWATSLLNMSDLSEYDLWVAQYYKEVTYAGKYTMWQYSKTGSINGINGAVDLNYSYKDYAGSQTLKNQGNKSNKTSKKQTSTDSEDDTNNYPAIIQVKNGKGTFIDKSYPNLFSPEFIHKGDTVSWNDKSVRGINNSDGINNCAVVQGVPYGENVLVIPNCVGYVRARWIQLNGGKNILNVDMNCNASGWFSSPNLSQYEHSPSDDDDDSTPVPKQGAIMCKGGGSDGFGHVAVVEQVNDDGSFWITESNYYGISTWLDLDDFDANGWYIRRGVRIRKIDSVSSVDHLHGFIYFPYEFNSSGVADHTKEEEEQIQVWRDLYTEPIERTDATVRDVGYLNPSNHQIEPTSSNFGVSAINYTPVLNAIYNYNNLGKALTSSSSGKEPANKGYTTDNSYSENVVNVEYKTDGCAGDFERQTVVDYLLSRGLSRAQVAGICGNIKVESGYRPWSVEGDYMRSRLGICDYSIRDTSMDSLDTVENIKNNSTFDYNHGIGLLAWTFPPFEISMVAYCEKVFGKPWYDTVEGQLEFFLDVQLGNKKWEYTSDKKKKSMSHKDSQTYAATDSTVRKVLEVISGYPNTVEGAKDICEQFMWQYENPGVPALEKRQAEAEFVFNHIVPYQKKSEGNTQKSTK